MDLICENCGKSFRSAVIGRPKRFCHSRCRVQAHRLAKSVGFPVFMTSKVAWVRADGKRPIQIDGSPASSTDPSTWDSFAAVQDGAGSGFGIMLGGGLGCYDFDHKPDSEVRAWVKANISERIVYAERSMSGDGVHVFIEAEEAKGWKRDGIERYSRARFIRNTGDSFLL